MTDEDPYTRVYDRVFPLSAIRKDVQMVEKRIFPLKPLGTDECGQCVDECDYCGDDLVACPSCGYPSCGPCPRECPYCGCRGAFRRVFPTEVRRTEGAGLP